MLILSAVSIIASVIILLIVARLRRTSGIPAGRVIYIDTSHWIKVEKALFDKELRLTGKPDYLVRNSKEVIPIEVKSGHAPRQPYPWHISQLAAYCLLVHSEYGTRPHQGILRYANRTIAIEFTCELETATRGLIREMQERTSQLQIDRSHHDQNRCIHCGYRSICDQALRI